MKRLKRTVGLALAGLTGLGLSGIGLLPAGADQPHSDLLATPSPVNLDLLGTTSLPVTVNLDPQTCLNSLNNGNDYSITAVSQDSTVATVLQGEIGPLQCSSDNQKGLPYQAVFNVSANPLACTTDTAATSTSTSVLFDPVAGPQGLQDKLSGISVTVNVANVPQCSGESPGPGGNGRPAAPQVAGAYLMANSNPPNNGLVVACQQNVPHKGNGWFGAVISTVAGSMPRPESVKDKNFASDGAWTAYVQSAVSNICNNITPWWAPLPPPQ